MAITVTDPKGATLSGIHVEAIGVADRSGDTDDSGTLRFANLRAGSYRLRFSGDDVITFEREVGVRAGQTADVDVTLNPAEDEGEEPERAEPQPAPAAAPVGPAAQPMTLDIPEFADRNLIRREPRRESPITCSGNARATLVQLNEPQPERLYDTAETMYYVVAGEGTIRVNGRESPLVAGTFALVPRGAAYSILRKGRNPIVLLSVLSGEPCQSQ
jgi:mannose-6-phosphate isomerase-like protein (cupin superfamily)